MAETCTTEGAPGKGADWNQEPIKAILEKTNEWVRKQHEECLKKYPKSVGKCNYYNGRSGGGGGVRG